MNGKKASELSPTSYCLKQLYPKYKYSVTSFRINVNNLLYLMSIVISLRMQTDSSTSLLIKTTSPTFIETFH